MTVTPLRDRRTRRLIFAYGVNQLGDWAGELALSVLVYAATGSTAAVAATFVAHRALLAFASPLLVSQLEAHAGMRALPAVYLAQAALFGGLIAGAGLGLVAILPLVVLDGLLAPSARALARSALAAAAGPALRETNALVNVVFTVNGVLAPAAGGALIAVASARAALALDAASFVLAAATVTRIGLSGPARGEQQRSRMREAFAHVRDSPVLGPLLLGNAALALVLATIAPIEVAFITGTLDQSVAALGAVVTAWGVGMVVGAALPLRNVALPALLAGATFVLGLSCLGMGASNDLTGVLVWSAVGGIGNGVLGMAFVTTVQEHTASAFQARVGALYEMSVSVAPGLGFVLGGAVASLASPRAVYYVAGVGALVVLAAAVAVIRPRSPVSAHA